MGILKGMNFYLGTHRPKWVSDPRFEAVPVFLDGSAGATPKKWRYAK